MQGGRGANDVFLNVVEHDCRRHCLWRDAERRTFRYTPSDSHVPSLVRGAPAFLGSSTLTAW